MHEAPVASRLAAWPPRRPAGCSGQWLGAAFIVVLFAILASRMGSDADWDLRNYHEYNAHALISGRFWSDIAPAQLQTFYSPFMDIALGAVRDALNDAPVLRNVVLSLPFGAAAALAFLLTLRVLPGTLPGRRLVALAAALCSAAGAAGYPTLATAMSDAVPGACILAGLLLLTGETAPTIRAGVLAGVLFGIAGGLKLTVAPYCIAGAVALAAVPHRAGPPRLASVAGFILGGLAAGAMAGGPWWLLLYRHFGNPVLPYLNQYFIRRSSILCRSLTHASSRATLQWRWPIRSIGRCGRVRWRPNCRCAIHASHLPVSQSPPWPVRALRRRPDSIGGGRTVTMLAVFFAVSFVLWELQFSVLRYLATLELLTGAIVLAALRPLLLRPAIRAPVALGFVVLCVAVQAVTAYPNWGRMAAPLPMRVTLPTTVEPNALVVLLDGSPMAYLADLLPVTVRLVGANNNLVQLGGSGLLAQQAAMAIRNHVGPLYGLEDPAEAPRAADRTLVYYNLRRDSCAAVESNLDNNAIRWCRLLRQSR